MVPPIKRSFLHTENVRVGDAVTAVAESLCLTNYLSGEQELLFFRRERTQIRHLTIGGLKPVKILGVFLFITDKKPFLNCWEVYRGNTGLCTGRRERGKGVKEHFAVELPMWYHLVRDYSRKQMREEPEP